MKFTVETKKFINALSKIDSIFQKSGISSPKGNDVLISTENNMILIEVAHKGMYIKDSIEAESIDTNGEITINLIYILKLRLLNKEITFDYDKIKNRINFLCGGFKGYLNVSQGVAQIKEQRPDAITTKATLPIKSLREGIKLTSFTPNKSTTLLPINIVTQKHNELHLRSYDSTCAAYFTTVSKEETFADLDVLVPAKFLNAVFDKLDKKEYDNKKIVIGIGRSILKLNIDNMDIYYPTRQKFQRFNLAEYYQGLMKEQSSLSFRCHANVWLEAIRMTASLTAGLGLNDNRIIISMHPERHHRALVDISSSIGEGTSEFDLIDMMEDKVKKLIISSLTYTEFLSNIEKEEIEVRLYLQPEYRRVYVDAGCIKYLLPLAQDDN